MNVIYKESFDEDITPEIKGTYEKILIRKPILPKIAKVERYKQVGQRKWNTVYNVKDEEAKILFTSEKQGEAIERAKELAIKNIKTYYVNIGKALFNADPCVAMVTPGKHRPGKWKFLVINA